MKLLTEINEDIEYVTEAAGEDGKKSYFLEGIFLQSDTKNKNGRIYPASVLGTEINRYNEEYVSKNRAVGELNHPSEPTINLDKVSHKIISLKQEGKDFIGKAKIMTEMPNGKIVQALIDENCRLGVSSRGLGSLKEANGSKIVEALILTTAADIVADPSVAVAMPAAILENYEWFWDGITWDKKEKIFEMVQEHKQFTREQREAAFLKLFTRFVDTLNS